MPDPGPQDQVFRPFRADPSADAKTNALRLLEWATEALWRTHEHARISHVYSRAVYEALARQAGAIQHPAPHPSPSHAPGLGVVLDLGRILAGNRAAILELLKRFF